MTKRWCGVLVGLAIGAASCTSAGIEIDADGTLPIGDSTADSVSTSVVETTTSVAESTTTQNTPTSADPSITSKAASDLDWTVERLGPAMIGTGEFIRISDRPEDPDSECQGRWLGYRPFGEPAHRYDDLGQLGFLRLFNGSRGQDALVESCEESIGLVLIQGSAVLPPSGVPEFTNFPLGDPWHMDFSADFGWRGDVFGAIGTTWEYDELVLFSTLTSEIVEAHEILGERVDRPNHGYDFVLPTGWTLDASGYDDPSVTMNSPDGLATIRIQTIEFAGDPEPVEEAEMLTFFSESGWSWNPVEAGEQRAKRARIKEQLNWIFTTQDSVQRIVHQDGEGSDLIIEIIMNDDAPNSLMPVANLAVELVRHHSVR